MKIKDMPKKVGELDVPVDKIASGTWWVVKKLLIVACFIGGFIVIYAVKQSGA